MKIGIDLLWVRPGKCGGTESYIRNLLDGFAQYCPEEEFVLYVTRDNAETFRHYVIEDTAQKGTAPMDSTDAAINSTAPTGSADGNMRLSICPADCAVQWKRIAWENLRLAKRAERDRIDVMFIPVYSKPLTYGSGIPYITVIHDLQALHFPQYFSGIRRFFLKNKWRYACRTSAKVVTISDFCKKDIIEHYPFAKDKIVRIYNPIVSSDEKRTGCTNPSADGKMSAGQGVLFAELAEKYGVAAGGYFYCVSSMLPHKNLITILKLMAALKKAGKTPKLVLSGVGGQNEEFAAALKELDIEDAVVQTGFVSDEERDCLYENCEMFLFPSVFEGFGMPPIEAMRKGKTAIVTRESCLEEVTDGKAVYIDDPVDVEEWIRKVEQVRRSEEESCAADRRDEGTGKADSHREPFPQYEPETIVRQFAELFRGVKSDR